MIENITFISFSFSIFKLDLFTKLSSEGGKLMCPVSLLWVPAVFILTFMSI